MEKKKGLSCQEIPGWCALCRSRCGQIVLVERGELVGVRPDPSHPTGGALCVKGRAAPEFVSNPQRLLYPMRRTRAKTDPDPGWQRIGWDEALHHVAQALGGIAANHGPEAVVFALTSPSSSPISDGISFILRFINRFGSPNILYATEICNWHKDFGHAFTFGRGISSPDFANAGCVLLWGHNPSASWLYHATAVAAARKRGARIVVVDPSRAGAAAQADQWLRRCIRIRQRRGASPMAIGWRSGRPRGASACARASTTRSIRASSSGNMAGGRRTSVWECRDTTRSPRRARTTTF